MLAALAGTKRTDKGRSVRVRMQILAEIGLHKESLG